MQIDIPFTTQTLLIIMCTAPVQIQKYKNTPLKLKVSQTKNMMNRTHQFHLVSPQAVTHTGQKKQLQISTNKQTYNQKHRHTNIYVKKTKIDKMHKQNKYTSIETLTIECKHTNKQNCFLSKIT